MWKLQDHTAQLHLARLSAEVEVRRPDLGIQHLEIGGVPFHSAQLLGTRISGDIPQSGASVIETYLRGQDLVARYAATEQSPLESMLYWRIVSVGEAEGFDLLISLQTNLLDSQSIATTSTQLPAEEVLRLVDSEVSSFEKLELSPNQPYEPQPDSGLGVFLFRLPNSQWSYAEMAHPSDFEGAQLSLSDGPSKHITLQFRLFESQHLEKGVIRCARVRGVFTPRENDQQTILDCYHHLSAQTPPLTT